jgi:hypothetical protein
MTHCLVALFMTLVLGPLVGPLAGAAPPSAPVPRIGLLSVLSPALGEAKAESFRQGLRQLGYVEGQNILLEPRWACRPASSAAPSAMRSVRKASALSLGVSPAVWLPGRHATGARARRTGCLSWLHRWRPAPV